MIPSTKGLGSFEERLFILTCNGMDLAGSTASEQCLVRMLDMASESGGVRAVSVESACLRASI
jgi:hypothetical protein